MLGDVMRRKKLPINLKLTKNDDRNFCKDINFVFFSIILNLFGTVRREFEWVKSCNNPFAENLCFFCLCIIL